VNDRAEKCGYNTFLNEALNFPPRSPFPFAPDEKKDNCTLWDEIVQAAYYVNPCFNEYHLTDYCPYLWNQMGVLSLAGGPNNYFNRSDVQALLHVPQTNYSICRVHEIFPSGDMSPPSAFDSLPSVIERTNNTIIAHGWLDFKLFMNGSLATIQNMTWNGLQGFQFPPTEPLYVPYHYGLAEVSNPTIAPRPFTLDAGAGHQGTAHTERGLTFTTVYLAGHGELGVDIPRLVAYECRRNPSIRSRCSVSSA
jgi:carboxypeptidase D